MQQKETVIGVIIKNWNHCYNSTKETVIIVTIQKRKNRIVATIQHKETVISGQFNGKNL